MANILSGSFGSAVDGCKDQRGITFKCWVYLLDAS